MKQFALILIFPLFANSQSWIFSGSYPGDARHHPVTFSNDKYGFIIAGQNGNGQYLDDVFKYNSELESWEQLDNFPGGPRGYAYGVANSTHGYVGFGSNDGGYPNDWWRYNFVEDSWVQLANFPDVGRNHPAMVIVENKVFVGLGSADGENLGDWWEYNILNDSWSQKASFNFGDRHHPFYFSINNTPYVGFGHGDYINDNITIYKDFYKYEVSSNQWTQLNDFPSEGRVAGTQFSFNGKGYVLSGDGDDHGPLDSGELWEYDPVNDNWIQLTSHPGGARWAPGSFVIDCNVFLTSGYEAETDTYYNDIIKLKISEDCGCTNENAFNYNNNATLDDNSCCYVSGCTEEIAYNYNPDACFDDGSCTPIILGCNNPLSSNYNPEANSLSAFAGPNYIDLGPGGYHYNDLWDMIFSCSEEVIIKSIDLYAENSFNTTVEILDNNNNQIYSQNISLIEGLNQIELNYLISPGDNYKIGINGDNQGLYRNNSLVENTLPLNLFNIIEITSNTTDSPLDYYYYFYNWQLEKECENIIDISCTDELACNYLNPIFLNDPTCLYPFDECVSSVSEGGDFIYGTYDENCDCILQSSNVLESNQFKKVIKTINILGQESHIKHFLIMIYDDGSVERKIEIK
ncbi:hypothetical protein N9U48_00615 [Bacteroidota bacterium]|nr:hypothetical protein [Bacteroidota bacterium]